MAFWRAKNTGTNATPEEQDLGSMSFGEHIEDLRKRLLWALVGGIIVVGVCAYYINPIVQFLVHPYLVALDAAGHDTTFMYQRPAQPVVTYLNLAIWVGLIGASPWIIWQLWLFIASGLYQRERLIIYRYIVPSIFLFLSGVAFFFFIVLPISLRFFISFGDETGTATPQPWPLERVLFRTLEGDKKRLNPALFPEGDAAKLAIPMVRSDPTTAPADHVLLWYNATERKLKGRQGEEVFTLPLRVQKSLFTPLPSLDDYLDFITLLALVFGVSFEMPMVIMILAQVGIVSVASFGKIRKYAYFGCAVVASVATPTTDLLTMMMLFVPLVGLYELGIVLARIVVRKRAAEGE